MTLTFNPKLHPKSYKNSNEFCNFLGFLKDLAVRTVLEMAAILLFRALFSLIRLLNNKFHGLSPSGGHHSLLFDQGFKKIAGRD